METVLGVVSTAVLIQVGIFLGIYALLAIGMNMHWGDAGLLNFAHAAFFAVGAYTTAILTTPPETGLLAQRTMGYSLPIPVGMAVGTLLAGVVGVLIATTSIRLEGDYLAMVTLSGAELLRLLISNEGSVTGGVQGLGSGRNTIPRPLSEFVDGLVITYDLFYFLLVTATVVACYLVFTRLSGSPFGRVLHAIREDEDVPKALGKDTRVFKLKAFGIGAAVAGLAGALWAHYLYSINPTMFLPNLTFLVWAAVIIGGAGSYRGAIAGTVFVMGIREATRFQVVKDLFRGANETPVVDLLVPSLDKFVYVRLMLVGALLILVLYYRPQGLFGNEERLTAGSSGGE